MHDSRQRTLFGSPSGSRGRSGILCFDMTDDAAQPVATFARAVAEAARDLSGFEATQTVEAGPIRVVARIRHHRPEVLTVEYRSYANPLLDLEERLTGDVDYSADELIGLSLHYDGRQTWCHDASTGVCVVNELYRMHGDEFEWREAHFDRLCGTDAIRKAIVAQLPFETLKARWETECAAFRRQSRAFLLYPE